MKTTLEIPDDLFREAKAKAALEGRKLKDLVADALRAMLAGNLPPRNPRRVQFPIIKTKPGGGSMITKKMVDEAEEQMLKEEAQFHGKFMRR